MAETEGIEKRWSLFATAQDIVDTKFKALMDPVEGTGIVYDQIEKIRDDILDIEKLLEEARDALGDITGATDVTLSDVSDIEDAVHDKLIADLANESPAIPDAVEDAIFARESERAALLHQDTLDNISDEWSKRGFTLPNGYLSAAISQAEIDYTNKRLDVSRDIAIKNFELTDSNMKFAIQQGIVFFDAKLKQAIAEAEMRFKNIDNDLKALEYQYTLAMEGIKAITVVDAQILAGAFSGISTAANISASDQGQYTYTSNPSY